MLVRAWRKVNSPKHVRISQPLSAIMARPRPSSLNCIKMLMFFAEEVAADSLGDEEGVEAEY